MPWVVKKEKMPHITIEKTANVEMKFHSFFKELTESLVKTGHASQLGIKCRVVTSEDFYIADGNPKFKMVNLLFRLREGRSPEVLEKFSQLGMDLMKKYLNSEIEKKQIILSTEIKELIKGRDFTFNAIR